MQPVMERSHPTSGRPATPADINRNGRPTSIGTSGRHQSECPADIIGMRTEVDIFVLSSLRCFQDFTSQGLHDVGKRESLLRHVLVLSLL